MALRQMLFLGLCSVPAIATPARSEVVHGFQYIHSTYIFSYGGGYDEAFDFLTRTIVPWSSDAADLSHADDGCVDPYPTLHSKNCIGAQVDAPLAVVSQAPSGLVPFSMFIKIDQSVVLKTGDNLYVKFAVRSADGEGINIEYYVQTDGSPSFETVATKPSTWGSVKALYR